MRRGKDACGQLQKQNVYPHDLHILPTRHALVGVIGEKQALHISRCLQFRGAGRHAGQQVRCHLPTHAPTGPIRLDGDVHSPCLHLQQHTAARTPSQVQPTVNHVQKQYCTVAGTLSYFQLSTCLCAIPQQGAPTSSCLSASTTSVDTAQSFRRVRSCSGSCSSNQTRLSAFMSQLTSCAGGTPSVLVLHQRMRLVQSAA